MSKGAKGDAVTGDEVLGRTLSQTDNGPAEPSSGPPNRKVLRTLALVVLLGIAGVVARAKWTTVSSIFHGGNGSDRIIALSGRIEGDDSAVAPKTSGRILEVRVREGDSVDAGQILAVLDVTDELGPGLRASERDRVHRHFRTTSRYEWMFWDMGYRKEAWPV
jgi:hypothetical protein